MPISAPDVGRHRTLADALGGGRGVPGRWGGAVGGGGGEGAVEARCLVMVVWWTVSLGFCCDVSTTNYEEPVRHTPSGGSLRVRWAQWTVGLGAPWAGYRRKCESSPARRAGGGGLSGRSASRIRVQAQARKLLVGLDQLQAQRTHSLDERGLLVHFSQVLRGHARLRRRCH